MENNSFFMGKLTISMGHVQYNSYVCLPGRGDLSRLLLCFEGKLWIPIDVSDKGFYIN
jgi:hypothetical protein